MDKQRSLMVEPRGGADDHLVGTWAMTSFSTDADSLNDALSVLSGDDDASTSISGVSASARERDVGEPLQTSPRAQWSLGLSISTTGSIVRAAAAVPPPPLEHASQSVGSSTPSSEASGGASTLETLADDENEWTEEPLAVIQTVPVPESALAYLDYSLGGPVRKYCVLRYCERCCINRANRAWFHRRIRLRVWLGAACGQTIMGAFLLQYCFSVIGVDTWTNLGYAGLFFWSTIGALLAEGSMQAARAVVDTHAGAATPARGAAPGASTNSDSLLRDAPPSAPESHFQFMTLLLKSEVTEATALSVNRSVRLARLQAYGYMLIIVTCYICMLLAVRAAQSQGDWFNMMHQVIAVAGICLCPCTAMVVSGWLLFVSLPSIAVADHVRMSAHRVRLLGKAHSRDGQSQDHRRMPWNAVITAVEEAHVETLALGSVLAPFLVVMHMTLGLVVLWCILCALVSRKGMPSEDGSPGKVFQDFLTPPLFFCISGTTAVFAIWQLFGPADVTLACDELVEAIRSLRMKTSGRGRGLLADPAALVRVEGIACFADELNQGQGLGFCFRKTRITPQLVSGILVKSVLWMVLAFPALTMMARLAECPTYATAPCNIAVLPDVTDEALWSGAIHIFFLPLLLLAAWGLCRWTRHPSGPGLPVDDMAHPPY